MLLPKNLSYGKSTDLFYMEYNQRSGHYTMDSNHVHRHFELYYLFAGNRHYFITDRTYPICPGDLVVIGSNEVHRTEDAGIPNHERVVIYYDPRYFDELLPEESSLLQSVFFRQPPVLRLTVVGRLQFEQLLYTLLKEAWEQPVGFRLRIRNLSSELLLFIARHQINGEMISLESISPLHTRINQITDYLNQSFDKPLTLQDVAGQFYMSPSYLSRTFKQVTGFNFTEYVNTIRVRKAQQLLRDTDERITAIAASSGFDNLSHFEKVFKRYSEVTPRDYRAMQIKQHRDVFHS